MKNILYLLMLVLLATACSAKKNISPDTSLLTIAGKDYPQLVVSKTKDNKDRSLMRLEIERYTTATIRGIVIDAKKGDPIKNASIYIKTATAEQEVITDVNGYFSTSLDNSIEEIKVVHPTYVDLQADLKGYQF